MSSWAAGGSLDLETLSAAPSYHGTLLSPSSAWDKRGLRAEGAAWNSGWLSQELQAGNWGRTLSGLYLRCWLDASWVSPVLTGFVSSDWSSDHSDQEKQPLRAGLSPPSPPWLLLSQSSSPSVLAWPGAEQLWHCLKLTLALDLFLSTVALFFCHRETEIQVVFFLPREGWVFSFLLLPTQTVQKEAGCPPKDASALPLLCPQPLWH